MARQIVWSTLPLALLERVVLNQNRFRVPGVAPDARGAVLGQKGLLLFPSIDRVVGFFRVYSEESSIDLGFTCSGGTLIRVPG